MELAIGRELSRKELVHHKNGIKTDNRLENLQIVSAAEHRKLHQKKVIWRGRELTLRQAYARIGITSVGFRSMMRKRGWGHQQAFNFYMKEGKRR